MLALERITPENVAIFRRVRLRALEESPLAFGSTFARESQLSDADWLKRASDLNGERSIGFLAVASGEGCGLCGGFLDENESRVGHLVSMWVSPHSRRSGVGRTLVEAVESWAGTRGAALMRLTVTNCNVVAIRFYERNGYRMTGKTLPYPNDPSLFENEMERTLG